MILFLLLHPTVNCKECIAPTIKSWNSLHFLGESFNRNNFVLSLIIFGSASTNSEQTLNCSFNKARTRTISSNISEITHHKIINYSCWFNGWMMNSVFYCLDVRNTHKTFLSKYICFLVLYTHMRYLHKKSHFPLNIWGGFRVVLPIKK